MDADDVDGTLERLYQKYEREATIKRREQSRNRLKWKNTDRGDGSGTATAEDRASEEDADVTDQSTEKALGDGLDRFKSSQGKVALQGACQLIHILDSAKGNIDKLVNMRKGIWSDIAKEVVFRASPVFLLQSLENIDALEAVVKILRRKVNDRLGDGETEENSTELRDMMIGLNMCEHRLSCPMEGRVRFVRREVAMSLIANRSSRHHVISHSILTLKPIPTGLYPKDITETTVCVSNLPPGAAKEEIASYFGRFGEIEKNGIELPLNRFDSVQYTLHTRCKQLLYKLKFDDREDDLTSHEIYKVQKLLQDQELDRFFLEKLQSEVLLRAKALNDDEYDELESKTVNSNQIRHRHREHKHDEEHATFLDVRLFGVDPCNVLCTRKTRYIMFDTFFSVLVIAVVSLPFVVCVTCAYVLTDYGTPSNTSRENLRSLSQALLPINVIVFVCVLLLLSGGIAKREFSHHHLLSFSVLLNLIVVAFLIMLGVKTRLDDTDSARVLYVVTNAFYSLISTVSMSVGLSHIMSKYFRCCEGDVDERGDLQSGERTRKGRCSRALDDVYGPLRSKCPFVSIATCVRTFRCVTCFIPSRCTLSSLIRFDCISRHAWCCDCVDVQYAAGERGTKEMKADLEHQCNALLETMKMEDLSIEDPALHHYADRMRWKIKRLKRLVAHRQSRAEMIKFHPERMIHQTDCFACGIEFDKWVTKKLYCSACGYAFCRQCRSNVRTLDKSGIPDASVCAQCAMWIDRDRFNAEILNSASKRNGKRKKAPRG